MAPFRPDHPVGKVDLCGAIGKGGNKAARVQFGLGDRSLGKRHAPSIRRRFNDQHSLIESGPASCVDARHAARGEPIGPIGTGWIVFRAFIVDECMGRKILGFSDRVRTFQQLGGTHRQNALVEQFF